MSSDDVVLDLRHAPERKYTRGEHCIYTNLVITFAVLTITVGVYLVHIFYVNHDIEQTFRISGLPVKVVLRDEEPEYWPLSTVSLGVDEARRRVLCHGVLLRATWTVAPGHCVALRKHYALAKLRATWRITYPRNTTGYEETAVKSSLTHPAFSAEDLQHNVGLLEHSTAVLQDADQHMFSQYQPITDLVLEKYQEEIYMVGLKTLNTSAAWTATMMKNLGQWIARDTCRELVAPVASLRANEFCLAFPTPRSEELYPGEAVVLHGRVVGLVSWGDRGAHGVPFVALNLLYYDVWMRDATSPPAAAAAGL